METTTTTTTVTTVTKSTTVTSTIGGGGGEGWAQSKKNQLFKTVKNFFSKASKKASLKQITNGENNQHQPSITNGGDIDDVFYFPKTPARMFTRKIKKTLSYPRFDSSSKQKSAPTTATSSSLFTSDEDGGGDTEYDRRDTDVGGGEIWKRSILLGEKCDPLNFSGAIFYDSNGRITDNKGSNPRTNSRRKLTFPVAGSGDY